MAKTVLHPKASDIEQLGAVRDQIDRLLRQRPPCVVSAGGVEIELPASALEGFRMVVDSMSRGQSITLIPQDKELTSQEAADVLLVSRPHLIKLLDDGEMPFRRVGTHRRLRIEDVLAYRDRRRAARDAALTELTRLSEELPGGYR
jgi:excisionase family DNA binding protein